MSQLTYTIRLEPADEGGYIVTVPALPGCMTQGDTFEEAVHMAREAIQGHVETLIELNQPVPHEPDPRSLIETRVQIEILVAS